jgi:hypothetical protein
MRRALLLDTRAFESDTLMLMYIAGQEKTNSQRTQDTMFSKSRSTDKSFQN